MIERICAFIHNYFTHDKYGVAWHRETGSFTIENGTIDLPFLANGQYFRIIGSRMNDGVYQYPEVGLLDETFSGEIWEMRVPKAVQDIANEAETLETQYGNKLNSPYTSENVIGAYSYTKGSGVSGGGDNWLFGKDGVFGKRLGPWRKLHESY